MQNPMNAAASRRQAPNQKPPLPSVGDQRDGVLYRAFVGIMLFGMALFVCGTMVAAFGVRAAG